MSRSSCILVVLVFLFCLCAQFGCTEFYSYSNSTGKLYQWDQTKNTDTEVGITNLPTGLTFSSLTINQNNSNIIVGYEASDGRLATFDITTLPGTYTPKGVCSYGSYPIGFPALTYCNKDGKLYGIYPTDNADPGNPNQNKLYEITDIDTCSITEIGPLGVDFGNIDLACHPDTDTLYAYSSYKINNTTIDNGLYTVDKQTGAVTLKGESGIPTVGGVGLQFDPKLYSSETEHRLYVFVADHAYQLNPATGGILSDIGPLQNGGRLSLASRTK